MPNHSISGLAGKRVGKLLVLRPTKRRDKNGLVLWRCKCDCGRTTLVSGSYLAHSKTKRKSCGCERTNTVDLTGKRFGKLTALKATPERRGGSVVWACKCDCGKQKRITAHALTRNGTRSCGCLRKETHYPGRPPMIRVGLRYGHLTVIAPAERGPPTPLAPLGKPRYLCRCDCGNTKVVVANYLEATQSCGCAAYSNFNPGRAGLTVLLCRYRATAKRRGFSFRLSREKFAELTAGPCHYCGTLPSLTSRGTMRVRAERGDAYDKYTSYRFNGVDRVDSSRGYVRGNVVTCCHICNSAKSDLPAEEFLSWVKRLHQHFPASAKRTRRPPVGTIGRSANG